MFNNTKCLCQIFCSDCMYSWLLLLDRGFGSNRAFSLNRYEYCIHLCSYVMVRNCTHRLLVTQCYVALELKAIHKIWFICLMGVFLAISKNWICSQLTHRILLFFERKQNELKCYCSIFLLLLPFGRGRNAILSWLIVRLIIATIINIQTAKRTTFIHINIFIILYIFVKIHYFEFIYFLSFIFFHFFFVAFVKLPQTAFKRKP